MALLIRDFLHLQKQIREFDIEGAECHCCSVEHRDPETGARLPCDRELIHSMLQQWSRSYYEIQRG